MVDDFGKAENTDPRTNSAVKYATARGHLRSRDRELNKIYRHRPESKKTKSSEGISSSIHPYGRYGNAGKKKTSKMISNTAILWPVKAKESRRGPLQWR